MRGWAREYGDDRRRKLKALAKELKRRVRAGDYSLRDRLRIRYGEKLLDELRGLV